MIPGLNRAWLETIERIQGILNGTCNFILSEMEKGAEFTKVLAEAQARGSAEADPTEDVGGFDARAKLTILMRLVLRAEVDPEEIVPRSLTTITPVDFSYARDLGCTIRQVSRAEQVEALPATVGPMLLSLQSPWHGRREWKIWSSPPATTAAMWSSPATAPAANLPRSPWSAI